MRAFVAALASLPSLTSPVWRCAVRTREDGSDSLTASVHSTASAARSSYMSVCPEDSEECISILCYIMLFYVMLHYVIQYHIILHHSVWYGREEATDGCGGCGGRVVSFVDLFPSLLHLTITIPVTISISHPTTSAVHISAQYDTSHLLMRAPPHTFPTASALSSPLRSALPPTSSASHVCSILDTVRLPPIPCSPLSSLIEHWRRRRWEQW